MRLAALLGWTAPAIHIVPVYASTFEERLYAIVNATGAKFDIGNVGPGWTFQITRRQCRRLDGQPYKPSQWIFGYSPDARRWGWVQAIHLPSCTS